MISALAAAMHGKPIEVALFYFAGTCAIVLAAFHYGILVWDKFAKQSKTLDVHLMPSSGPSAKQLLAVTNNGRRNKFNASCKLVARRNDPNKLNERSYDLAWDRDSLREITLSSGEASNLLIAWADDDRAAKLSEVVLLGLSNGSIEKVEYSRWNHGQKNKPEYDLEISIFGDHGLVTELFTLRCDGPHSALEMIKKEQEPSAPVIAHQGTRLLRYSVVGLSLSLAVLVIIGLFKYRSAAKVPPTSAVEEQRNSVHPSFQVAWKLHDTELGHPISGPQLPMGWGGDQMVFEHGVQIYTQDFMYVLWDSGIYELLTEQNAPAYSKDSPWWKDTELRKMLEIPKNHRPPYGSMAVLWKKDPEHWRKLGNRLWHCDYNKTALTYQDFENGRMIGIFRDSQTADDSGRIYILILKGSRWESWRAVGMAPRLTDDNHCGIGSIN